MLSPSWNLSGSVLDCRGPASWIESLAANEVQALNTVASFGTTSLSNKDAMAGEGNHTAGRQASRHHEQQHNIAFVRPRPKAAAFMCRPRSSRPRRKRAGRASSRNAPRRLPAWHGAARSPSLTPAEGQPIHKLRALPTSAGVAFVTTIYFAEATEPKALFPCRIILSGRRLRTS